MTQNRRRKNSRCAHGYRQNSLKSDVHVSLNVTDKIHAYRAPNKSERFFARRRQNVHRSEMIIASLFAIASNRKCQRQKVLFHLCLISDLSRASSIATSDFRGNLPMCLCMISFEIFNSQTPVSFVCGWKYGVTIETNSCVSLAGYT
jgi:hypothetical protein